LDKLIGIQRSFYDRTCLGFNQNPRKAFQKFEINKKAKRKCSNYNRWGHQTSKCYKKNIHFRKVTNMQGPEKLWVSKILLLSGVGMFVQQQKEKVVVLGQWMLQAYD